jgi:DNA (cytosine-5)-methyltransferase 1
MESVLANDFESRTLDIFGLNFEEADLRACPIEELLDSPVGSKALSLIERRLRSDLGPIDLVIGGPPCQGNSNLNNHTRNADPKNELYMRMVRFCEVIRPESVVIENVPGVIRDRGGVAQRAWKRLEQLGYSVDTMVIDASMVGAAQKRRRSITVASLLVVPSLADAVFDVAAGPRPVTWAISDLIDLEESSVFDTPAEPSAENARRMKYLIDQGIYELPDSKRPDCHRLKPHTYDAVYGRLYPDRPSPTITTGFGSMGRGRFTHYALPRTITPHEAARIQFFPDFYDFGDSGRTLLHRMIGNAVPPKLGYAIGLHLLR